MIMSGQRDGGPETGARDDHFNSRAGPAPLAHGLLDHAERPLRTGDDKTAGTANGEACSIAQRLRCQPLLDRAETIQPTRPRTAAP
jgi:hypothetical protein